MNRRLLIGVFILACFCLVTGVSYACVPIGIYISPTYYYVEVSDDGGNTVSVTANVDYGGPATSWNWRSGGLQGGTTWWTGYGSQADFWSDTAGTYWPDVEARTSSSDDDAYAIVKVVEVTDVMGSRDVLDVGEEWTYAAVTYPSNCHPYVDFSWDTDGGTYTLSSGSSLCTVSWDTNSVEPAVGFCKCLSCIKLRIPLRAIPSHLRSFWSRRGPFLLVLRVLSVIVRMIMAINIRTITGAPWMSYLKPPKHSYGL